MENLFVEKCLQKLEEKANQGPSSEWTDGTFSALSDSIAKETKILISKNTLKRLFGKMKRPVDYSPQRETKNALARYAGYADWADFLSVEFGTMMPEKADGGQDAKQKANGIWLRKGGKRGQEDTATGNDERDKAETELENAAKNRWPNWNYIVITSLVALGCSILVMLVKTNAEQAKLNSIEIACKKPE